MNPVRKWRTWRRHLTDIRRLIDGEAVHMYLGGHPGAYGVDIADGVRLPIERVHDALARLEAAGLVAAEREVRSLRRSWRVVPQHMAACRD